jgi:hypothetical protein
MRTITIAAVVLMSAGCNFSKELPHGKPLSISITVAVDPTNKRAYYPTPDEVLRQFNFTERPEAACNLRLRLIGDKQHTISKTIRLADAKTMAAGNTTFDSRYRDRNIEAFIKCGRNEIQDFYHAIDTSKEVEHSEIYRTLTQELWLLVRDSSDKKVVIAVTDAREKSELFDSYRAKHFDVKKVAERLNRAYPLPENLQGVAIIFLFNPRDRNEDIAFSRSIELFKHLYESRGAKVEVKTSL